MPKRLSDNQKEEITNRFKKGTSIDQLSIDLGFTKLTISKNLKKSLGDDLFNSLAKKTDQISKSKIDDLEIDKISIKKTEDFKNNNFEKDNLNESSKIDENGFINSSFIISGNVFFVTPWTYEKLKLLIIELHHGVIDVG